MYQAKQPAGPFRPPNPSNRPRNPYARSQVPRQPQPQFPIQNHPATTKYAAPPTLQQIPGLGELPQIRKRAPHSYDQRGQNRNQPYQRPSQTESRPNTYSKQSPWEDTTSLRKASSQQAYDYGAPRGERMEVAEVPAEQDSQEPTFICDLCDMKCKSEFIYDQHMKGKGHQKKVKRLELEKLWEKKDPSVYCKVCDLELNPSAMEMHLAGAKHKELLAYSSDQAVEVETNEGEGGENSEGPQSSQDSLAVNVPCELCSITLNTLGDLIRHFKSKPHMKMCVEKYLEEKRIAEANPFYCKLCEVGLNGQKTYDAHIQGNKHKYRLANAGYDPSAQPYGTAAEIEAYDPAYTQAYPQQTYTNAYTKPQVTVSAKPQMYANSRTSGNDDPSKVYPYTASQFVNQAKAQEETYTSAFARDIPNLYCDICNVSFNGKKPYEDHIQGYRHNYKLTNGNFDPNSAFGQKFMKIKAKLARKRQMEEEMTANSEQVIGEVPEFL